jgi:phosphoacetylglucosamine mutase
LVDCANGVGSVALRDLSNILGNKYVEFITKNDDIDNSKLLNHECGADYVKMKQMAPKGTVLSPGQRSCSLDGDSDRIVFYYIDGNSLND